MKLSIVVPTLGRKKEIAALFASIRDSQLTFEYEVIVVDQNMDGLIDDVCRSFREMLPIQQHKVRFRGISKAKNYGTNHAIGEIICFPDDDAEFCANTISYALKLLDDKNITAVFGKCVDKSTGKDSVIHFKSGEQYLTLKNFEGAFIDATMFAIRSELIQYSYDETMGVGTIFGAHEGYDLVYRMLKDRITLYYSSNIVFYHPSKISAKNSSAEIRRAFYYSCGLGYLCRKHGFRKKYVLRYLKLLSAYPVIFLLKNSTKKYYMAQLLGMKLGYSCLIE